MSRELVLHVPGLLGPWDVPLHGYGMMPELPALTRLLNEARSREIPYLSPEAQALRWFGLRPEPGQDWPVAAMEYRVTDDAYWLRADPVIFHPDRDRLLLFDGARAELTRDEHQALTNTLNQAFAEQDWRFQDKYLRLPEDPKVQTKPLRDALGRSVDRLLPWGPGATRLHARLTEMEMLLHAHPVNERRRMQGRATVDGIWLWGGGRRMPVPGSAFERIFDQRSLVQALGPVEPVPGNGGALLETLAVGRNLVTLMDLDTAQIHGDVSAWLQALPRLEEIWFRPLWNALRAGRLQCLELWGGDGRAHLVVANIPMLRRWSRWLSRRGLRAWDRWVCP